MPSQAGPAPPSLAGLAVTEPTQALGASFASALAKVPAAGGLNQKMKIAPGPVLLTPAVAVQAALQPPVPAGAVLVPASNMQPVPAALPVPAPVPATVTPVTAATVDVPSHGALPVPQIGGSLPHVAVPHPVRPGQLAKSSSQDDDRVLGATANEPASPGAAIVPVMLAGQQTFPVAPLLADESRPTPAVQHSSADAISATAPSSLPGPSLNSVILGASSTPNELPSAKVLALSLAVPAPVPALAGAPQAARRTAISGAAIAALVPEASCPPGGPEAAVPGSPTAAPLPAPGRVTGQSGVAAAPVPADLVAAAPIPPGPRATLSSAYPDATAAAPSDQPVLPAAQTEISAASKITDPDVPPPVSLPAGSMAAVVPLAGPGEQVAVPVIAALATPVPTQAPQDHPGYGLPALSRATPGDAPAPITIRLDPAELGRVQVRIDQPANGPAQIDLTVERAATLLLLLRDEPALHRALESAGLAAESRTVRFHLASPGLFAPLAQVDPGIQSADAGQTSFTGGPFAGGQPAGGQSPGGQSAGRQPDSGQNAGGWAGHGQSQPAGSSLWDTPAAHNASPLLPRRPGLARVDITA